jgi:hypothetical protein
MISLLLHPRVQPSAPAAPVDPLVQDGQPGQAQLVSNMESVKHITKMVHCTNNVIL